MSEARRARRQHGIALAVVWLACGIYGWHTLDRGWVPHDEGLLGQSAERVLRGEVPHRDFDEVYTGGLSYLNAAAFRVFGMNLLAPRLLLFVVFLVWIPVLYYIASRFAGPPVAGGVVVLAAAWSLPHYPAAIPSWYNLFLATFGAASLLSYLETQRPARLVAAGVFGGLSCLIKIIGLAYVAAVLLTLAYWEQFRGQDRERGESAGSGRSYSLLISAACAALVLVLVALIRARFAPAEVVHFVLPAASLAALLVAHEWRYQRGPAGERLRVLVGLAGPFLLGFLIPVAPVLAFYAGVGALGPLLSGVFVAPTRRLGFAAYALPDLNVQIYALPAAVMLGLVPALRLRRRQAILATGALPLLLYLSRREDVYYHVWFAIWVLLPLTVISGAWFLLRDRKALPDRRCALFALLAIAALVALVQFPFSIPLYFSYVAPLGILAALALVASREPLPWLTPAALGVFYLGFALLHLGNFFLRGQTQPLALERGGIVVSGADSDEYTAVVELIRAHATGDYIYAAPDSPEVYFLSGKRNPTRTLFDFFDDAEGRPERILHAIEARGVTVVALNQRPGFSARVEPELERELTTRFPEQATAGRFVIRWRRGSGLR